MRKIFSCCLLLAILSTIVSPVFALMAPASEMSDRMASPLPPMKPSTQIEYPVGEDFTRLRSLIELNFSKSNEKSAYNCIANRTLCPNYKYTSVIEKAMKLIVLKTYTGNEAFYNTLFGNAQSYGDISGKKTIKSIIDMIPRGSTLSDWKSLGFGNSIGGELMEASFGVNFTENANSSSMLGAIEQKIKEMKRNKCQKENSGNDSYKICPWNGDMSNTYLPTQEELYVESVYLNRGSVKIGSLKDEIEYSVEYKESNSENTSPKTSSLINSDSILALIPQQSINYATIQQKLTEIHFSGTEDEKKLIAGEILVLVEVDSDILDSIKLEIKEQLLILISGNTGEKNIQRSIPDKYILRYKKESYTLEEARAELEKKDVSNEEYVVSMDETKGQIPCKKYTQYSAQSQCVNAMVSLKEVQTGLAAYSLDTGGEYPESIDKLSTSYIRKFPQGFTDNFSYKMVKSNSNKMTDYEIRYIGHIGEGVTGSGETTNKKDYKAMMSGATVPEIPAIFSHVPSDSMVLYVRNPANLMDLLNQKSNTSQRLSGIDASESIRELMKTFFEIEKFEQIEKNLKHEMAIVVNNLDATAPDVVIIISSLDKDALSPTGKARVIGSTQDGYMFIASSKESLEKLTSLTVEKSLKNAPDFHYVWWKKSTLVKDALMFVGDEFFAKMLTLETYLTHYRKYRDYARLTSLQELAWAYGDAFTRAPTGFVEFTSVGLSTLTGEILGEYSIGDGLVTHRNIGTLKSIKTLPEAGYDLSKITRTELEDYKYNVLQYRDIWRASLDPMGIVMNRYADGMEVDFFMTPIPSFPDRDLQEIQKMFEGVTKDSFSFITNPKIRMGLVSFVWGFDLGKIQEKIQTTAEIKKGFEEFSKEVLDGKNIFDYIAGEFAFSIGNLDPDMLDGWNIEKIDIYGSVQVRSEEKGKELIDIIRTRILKEMGDSRGDEVEMIKGFLAKPLIEDYNDKKIYYVEGLPIPFVGKIGFAYTFVDDFFIIGANKSTIKNIIDIAKTGDTKKSKILGENTFEKGTFFATLFDGVSTSEKIKQLYEKNKSSIPRYMKYLDMADIRNDSSIDYLMGSYYSTQDRNKRLGIETKSFLYTLGTLEFSGDTEKLIVKIDTSGIKNLSGVTLQMWNNIESESNFPKDILSDKGISLADFLSLPNIGDFLSLNIIVQIDNAIGGTESLFRNITFGMNMGDDEIGFRLRVFRQSEGGKGISSKGTNSDILIMGGVVVFLIILGGLVWLVIRRRSIVPISAAPSMPSRSIDSVVIESSPVTVSSILLPSDITPDVDLDVPIPTPIIQIPSPMTIPVVSSPVDPVDPVGTIAPVVIESTSLIQDITPETK